MIAGPVRPDRGTATIDGRPFVELPNPTRVVGMLLDASAMHPGRSGRAALTIAARMAGVHPSRVEHMLTRSHGKRRKNDAKTTQAIGLGCRVVQEAHAMSAIVLVLLKSPNRGPHRTRGLAGWRGAQSSTRSYHAASPRAPRGEILRARSVRQLHSPRRSLPSVSAAAHFSGSAIRSSRQRLKFDELQ